MAGKVSTTEQDFTNLRGCFQPLSLLLWVWHDNIEVCSLFVSSKGLYLACPLIGWQFKAVSVMLTVTFDLSRLHLDSFPPELRIVRNLDPQRSGDWIQANGHPDSATSDCYQEDHTQTPGRGSLSRPPFLRQPSGEAPELYASSTGPGLLRYRLNPEPAHLQRSGEVGPAWPPASSPRRAHLWPAARPHPRPSAVHARPAKRS